MGDQHNPAGKRIRSCGRVHPGERGYNEVVRNVTAEIVIANRFSRASHGLGVMRRHQVSCGVDEIGPDLRDSDW
jgi:hypothetical protein